LYSAISSEQDFENLYLDDDDGGGNAESSPESAPYLFCTVNLAAADLSELFDGDKVGGKYKICTCHQLHRRQFVFSSKVSWIVVLHSRLSTQQTFGKADFWQGFIFLFL